MKKLILSVCAAAACWMSDAWAMDSKIVDGQAVRCKSRNGYNLMVTRWELGNISYIGSDCRYLYVDYSGTKKQFNQEKSKANLPDEMTRAMAEALETLPDSFRYATNLRVLEVYGDYGDEIYLKVLPDSIGDLKNLEELYLSKNYYLRKLPDSIGNLKNLKILNLGQTNLNGLPESMENLTNLEDLYLSHGKIETHYKTEDSYSSAWYYEVIKRSLEHHSCPTIAENEWKNVSSIDWSNKKLTMIPFCTHMLTSLEKIDVSNNQITKIPHLLKKLTKLKKLYLHNNPNLNHLPDFLWKMLSLEELKIDGKLIRDLPKNAEYSLDNENLEDRVLSLTLDGKNNKKMSDEELSRRTGPYVVHLKKN